MRRIGSSRPPTVRELGRNSTLVLVVAGMTATGCGAEVADGSGGDRAMALLPGLGDCGTPDGTVAVFWGSDEGVGFPGSWPGAPTGGDIWSIIATGRVVALTDDARSLDPWLSDDGQRVYFTRSGGGLSGDAPATGIEVWVRDLATGAESLLARADSEQQGGGYVTDPEGSPDGSSVTFQSRSGIPARERVYVMSVEPPGDPVEVPMPTPERGDFVLQSQPTFSPDGSRLAYVSSDTIEGGPGWSSIRLVELDTMAQSTLFAPPEPVGLNDLGWSPDGSELLAIEFGAGLDAGAVAVSIDVITGERTVLLDDALNEAAYAGADGTTLSAIGSDPRIGEWAQARQPVLTTWHDGKVEVRSLPLQLAFGNGLSIADCTFTQTEN